jgi:alanine dehydrogenase
MHGDEPSTLILSGGDIAALTKLSDWLEAVERGFRAGAEGKADAPAPLHIPAERGGFHAKGASIRLDDPERSYAALKLNGNFPGNPATNGLPTVQGVLILCDAATGSLLAVMDSIEITLRRTAAASALAAKLLAAPDPATFLICGCGAQGRAHLLALADLWPAGRWLAWDADADKAAAFSRGMARLAGLKVETVDELGAAGRTANVIVTCTSARTAFLNADHVAPGTFITAVGADSPDKSELAPTLMAKATIVTDSTAQCLAMGDLRHADAAGLTSADAVHAELGEIVAGQKPGRTSPEEIVIFDSTGTALQDVAAAAMIYEKAAERSELRRIALG